MTTWTVGHYTTVAGNDPVGRELDDLPGNLAARVDNDIALLEQFGTAWGMPHVRRLAGTNDLWELRTLGNPQARAIFVVGQGRRCVLRHVFRKSSQRIPKRNLDTAERWRADYAQRGLL
jgi:phage-related protein